MRGEKKLQRYGGLDIVIYIIDKPIYKIIL